MVHVGKCTTASNTRRSPFRDPVSQKHTALAADVPLPFLAILFLVYPNLPRVLPRLPSAPPAPSTPCTRRFSYWSGLQGSRARVAWRRVLHGRFNLTDCIRKICGGYRGDPAEGLAGLLVAVPVCADTPDAEGLECESGEHVGQQREREGKCVPDRPAERPTAVLQW
jgi:hypothetical protein